MQVADDDVGKSQLFKLLHFCSDAVHVADNQGIRVKSPITLGSNLLLGVFCARGRYCYMDIAANFDDIGRSAINSLYGDEYDRSRGRFWYL